MLSFFLERVSKAFDSRFPQTSVLRQPRVELAERLWPERIESPLPIWPHRNKARLGKDAQMTGHTGLVNPGTFNDVVNLPFAVFQCVNNPAARGVCENHEGA